MTENDDFIVKEAVLKLLSSPMIGETDEES